MGFMIADYTGIQVHAVRPLVVFRHGDQRLYGILHVLQSRNVPPIFMALLCDMLWAPSNPIICLSLPTRR